MFYEDNFGIPGGSKSLISDWLIGKLDVCEDTHVNYDWPNLILENKIDLSNLEKDLVPK